MEEKQHVNENWKKTHFCILYKTKKKKIRKETVKGRGEINRVENGKF